MAVAVMRPLSARGGAQSKWIDGQPMKNVAAGFVKPNDRLTALERLEIYNRQYWCRLKDCFYDDYKGLLAILGGRRFERLACAYLERHPSESFTLRNLGRRLVAFLEQEPQWTAPDQRPALDMARLEWAHIEAFDNESKPPLTGDSLLGVDPAQLRLKLQPHISLLQLGWNLDKFLIGVQHGSESREEASNAVELHRGHSRAGVKRRLKAGTIYLAVHRYAGSVHYKRLSAPQFRLLSALKANLTVGEACAEMAAREASREGLESEIAGWFETWSALDWFRALEGQ